MSHEPPYRCASIWRWIGKLSPPKTLLTSVARETVLASLRTHHQLPLQLLVAPAGYGKTTLMMQWRQELLTNTPRAAVAWLSLDDADGEPHRFLTCLILALNRAGVPLGHLSRLATSQALDPQPHRTVAALAQALTQAKRPVIVMIDDYHAINSRDVDQLMHTLIEQSAPWLRWVVATRTRPAWSLASWKTKGWVHEVSACELRLSLDETHRILGAQVSDEEAHQLHQTTEGWAVAVQLARLWQVSRDGNLYGLASFSGRVADVAEYLTEQVLTSLSPECQAFLFETAPLERFNAQLANAVRERDDSSLLLSQLSHLDSLLVPLDAERQWFRYHSLLRDFLGPKINASQAQRIHRAAAQWLAQSTDWTHAITHALKAQDTPLAISLVVRAGGWATVMRHGIRYAQSLVDPFDAQTRHSAPDLLLLQAYLNAKSGNPALATHQLQLAESASNGDPRLTRDLHVIGQLSNAYCDRFERTCIHLPAGEHPEQLLAQATLECVNTLALLAQGDMALALQTCRSAQAKMRLVASPRGESFCHFHEAQALALSGKVAESRQLIDKTLAFVHSHFGGESSLKSLIGCSKAQHCYWQGDWATATRWLHDDWASIEQTDGWLDVVAATTEMTWRITLRTQGLEAALLTLEHAAMLATTRDWQRLSLLVRAWRVDLLVQCGMLNQARKEVLDTNLQATACKPQDWRNHEAATLALARLQIATGAAQVALNRLEREAGVLRTKGLLLPCYRLQLMALAASCKAQIAVKKTDVLVALAPVTQHALPGLLLEVGPWLVPVLQMCVDELPAIKTTITHLRGWRAHPVTPKIPLSAKETQVLSLLANGQPNKTIAQALDISENTVKFHLKNIFVKLSVDNRTAAITAAVQQGLLNLSGETTHLPIWVIKPKKSP